MKEKILQRINLNFLNFFIEKFIFILAGFCLSFSKIAGLFAPFCLAFSVSLNKKKSACSFLGGFLGLLICLNVENVVYFFALIFGFIFKFFFDRTSTLFNVFCSAIALTIPKVVLAVLMPTSLTTWLIDYCEVVLSSAMTVLFSRTLKKTFQHAINNFHDSVGYFFIAMVFLIAMCGVNFLNLNLGRFISIILILNILILFKIGVVAIAGISIIISLVLFNRNFAPFSITIAICGFITSIFIDLNRFTKILIFNFIFILSALFWGGFQINCLIEIVVASVLTNFIPLKFLENLFNKTKVKPLISNYKINDELSFKLQFTAGTLLDLQTTIEKCASTFDSTSAKTIHGVYEQVANDVCKKCGLHSFCWTTSYNEMTRCLVEVSRFLHNDGKIEENKVPLFLKQKCCKLSRFLNAVNFEYKNFLCKKQISRRINEAREVAAEQFTGMAELLNEMSREILEIEKLDYRTCEIITTIFNDEFIKTEGIFCFLDKFDRLTVDIYLKSLPSKTELKRITNLINSVIDKEFEFPTVMQAKSNYRLSFFESAILKIDFAAKQTIPNGNTCSGDSYDFFMDGKGFAHMLLSDGMGNGKRAAVDSLMTCFTMRKLIETGFGFNSTLKLLNLSFSIKSKEESFATIDTCTIDLYSGYVKFVKAGATVSYISVGGKIKEFVSTSLPIGIIQGVNFDSKEYKLKKGDVIVMVSDGATSTGFEWIALELEKILKQSATTIAQKILNLAKLKSDPRHKDDITVMVSKII